MFGDDNNNGGGVWDRQDADRDVWGNPNTNGWGSPSDQNGWGGVPSDSQGNDWDHGSTDFGSDADTGGIIGGIIDFFGNMF